MNSPSIISKLVQSFLFVYTLCTPTRETVSNLLFKRTHLLPLPLCRGYCVRSSVVLRTAQFRHLHLLFTHQNAAASPSHMSLSAHKSGKAVLTGFLVVASRSKGQGRHIRKEEESSRLRWRNHIHEIPVVGISGQSHGRRHDAKIGCETGKRVKKAY